MVLDPIVAGFVAASVEANAGRPAIPEATVEEARAGYLGLAGLGSGPELWSVTDTNIDGPGGPIPVRVYSPSAGGGQPGLVFLHGGGWTIGSLETHDPECRKLAQQSGCVVVAVDYRLAPEHRYPAAVEDSWAALRHVASNGSDFGIDANRLAVGGDSAGGNLSVVVALKARDAGIVLRQQMLICPAVDMTMGSPSHDENAAGPLLTKAAMEWFAEQYFDGHVAEFEAEQDVSPIFAESLAGVAPAVVITAEHDPLRDEGNAYAIALMEAGVSVQATEWAGMPHAFFQLGPIVPHADRLIEHLAAALKVATA
jgi:acetyl esterase